MNREAISYLYPEDLYQIPVQPLIVILSRDWNQYSADDQTLLSKILSAVKLDLASVQVCAAREVSFSKLSSLGSARVLVFGSALEEVKPYEHFQAQGFSVIKADDLSALDDARKKNLWQAMRNMFGV